MFSSRMLVNYFVILFLFVISFCFVCWMRFLVLLQRRLFIYIWFQIDLKLLCFVCEPSQLLSNNFDSLFFFIMFQMWKHVLSKKYISYFYFHDHVVTVTERGRCYIFSNYFSLTFFFISLQTFIIIKFQLQYSAVSI